MSTLLSVLHPHCFCFWGWYVRLKNGTIASQRNGISLFDVWTQRPCVVLYDLLSFPCALGNWRELHVQNNNSAHTISLSNTKEVYYTVIVTTMTITVLRRWEHSHFTQAYPAMSICWDFSHEYVCIAVTTLLLFKGMFEEWEYRNAYSIE